MKQVKLLTAALLFGGMMFIMNGCKDPCKDVTCENGGTCNEGTCECVTGYEGTNCETEWRTKTIGTFSASDGCASTTYNVTISTSSSGVTKIILGNFGEYGCGNVYPDVVGTMTSATEFTMDKQTFCSSDSFTVQGSGSISTDGKTITINYSGDKPQSMGGGTYSCTVTLTAI